MTRRLAALLLPTVALAAARPVHAQAIGIAIEQRLAESARLAVGDTVRVASDRSGPVPAVVEAIYRGRDDPGTLMRREWHVRLHLADLALLVGQPDRVDRIGLGLAPGATIAEAIARLTPAAFGYMLVPTAEVAATSSTTFVVVARFHRAIGAISILASAIFLLCLMLLKVEERRLDVATLRLVGISRRTIVASLVLEASLLALAGSIAGGLLAVAASAVVNTVYQRFFDTALRFSWLRFDTVLPAVTLAMLLGVLAGLVAAVRLSRTSPARLGGRRG